MSTTGSGSPWGGGGSSFRPSSRSRRHGHSRRTRTPWTEAGLETLTEQLLFLGLMLSVWLAAGEPAWAFWLVQVVGWGLLVVQAVRWLDRRSAGVSALDEDQPVEGSWVGPCVAILIGFLLVWSLISALNSAGRVDLAAGRWIPAEKFVPWLPHSFDGPSSWKALLAGLATVGFFWGARNWLVSEVGKDRRMAEESGLHSRKRRRSKNLPRAMHRLLWMLGISGALLVLLAVLQRVSGSPKLLWLFEDPVGRAAEAHFGPFPYRNHAAQYLSMAWPLVIGLWLFGGRSRRRFLDSVARVGGSPRIILLACALTMLAGSVGTMSRGGWILAIMLSVVVCCVAGAKWLPRRPQWTAAGLAGLAVVISGILFALWPFIERRFQKEFNALALGRPEGVSEFTLAGSLDLVRTPNPRGLVFGLFDLHRGGPGQPRSVRLTVGNAGNLELMVWNEQRRLCGRVEVPEFVEKHRGSRVDLVLVGHEGIRLFINGELGAYLEPTGTDQAAWPERFAGNYLVVGGYTGRPGSREGITRVLFWDQAVPPGVVAAWFRGKTPADSGQPPAIDFDYTALGLRPLLWMKEGTLFGRDQVWASALEAMRQLGVSLVWGAGPGTYPNLYAVSPARLPGLTDWHVHNDYLEFLLTFGAPGATALGLALCLVLARPALRGGVRLPPGFVVLMWASAGGCLLVAFLDWPFFSPAVRTLFVVLAGLISCSSMRKKPRPRRGAAAAELDEEEEQLARLEGLEESLE